MSTHTDPDLVAVLPDYHRWLHKTANDLLPRAHSDHDDLVQEGYIAMWRALASWDATKGALPSWLTTAARMRMRDVAWGSGRWFGASERRGVTDVTDVGTVSADALEEAGEPLDAYAVIVEGPDLEEYAMWAYHEGEIGRALDELSPAQRRYVMGRFWCGLDPARSREPGTKELLALAPDVAGAKGRTAWDGSSKQKGARDRLAESLSHLAAA